MCSNNKKVLWLDDIRNPNDMLWNQLIWLELDDSDETYLNWDADITWATSYKEFVEYIEKNGMPDAIFFDHDLGLAESGMDCMKYLINKIQEIDYNPNNIKVFFQTANPIGKENMESLFENYLNFYNNK